MKSVDSSTLTLAPALALLEFHSIAAGIAAGDAMVKRAPVERILSGTIQPGYYLVLVTGEVADVNEAVAAGQLTGGDGAAGHGDHPPTGRSRRQRRGSL